MMSQQVRFNAREYAGLIQVRRELAAGDRHEFLTRQERDRLRFLRWRLGGSTLCPCGFPEYDCECVLDDAGEIAH